MNKIKKCKCSHLTNTFYRLGGEVVRVEQDGLKIDKYPPEKHGRCQECGLPKNK